MDSRKALAVALTLLGFAFRLFALVLCALTVILSFNGVATMLGIVAFVVDLTQARPDIIAGYGLIPTPFGGVFRFDFAVMAVVCFALDYALARISRSIR